MLSNQSKTAGRRLALGLVFALFPISVWAQSEAGPEPVIRVEEDWQLVLNEPGTNMQSPQFHTIMSPAPNLDGYYAQVLWNYLELLWYAPGGLQLQGWNGGQLTKYRTLKTAPLSTVAETITWTQILEINGGILYFKIDNGQSITWGTFGRDMWLDQEGIVTNLNQYSTATSADNSCITYGSNRVNSLVITQVRRYGTSGLLSTDSTPKVVYQLPEEE